MKIVCTIIKLSRKLRQVENQAKMLNTTVARLSEVVNRKSKQAKMYETYLADRDRTIKKYLADYRETEAENIELRKEVSELQAFNNLLQAKEADKAKKAEHYKSGYNRMKGIHEGTLSNFKTMVACREAMTGIISHEIETERESK